MADFQSIVQTPGEGWVTAEYRTSQISNFNNYQIVPWWLTLPVPGPSVAVYVYKMRGMDAAINALYGTWLVQGEPDSTGSNYTGALATPLRDIVVADSWPLS